MGRINLVPGIDFTKEDVALMTSSSVLHLPCERKDLTENWVTCYIGYGQGGYDINDCGDYLSIKSYEIKAYTGTVAGYKSAIRDEGSKLLKHRVAWGSCDSDVEIRIYKDCRVSVVHEVLINNDPVYYLFKKDLTDGIGGLSDGACLDQEVLKQLESEKQIKFVTTDEEIKKGAKKLLTKLINAFKIFVDNNRWYNIHGVKERNLYYDSCGCYGSFLSSTQEIVENFFDFSTESKNEDKIKAFKNKMGTHCGARLDAVYKLFCWLTIKDVIHRAETKEEKANRLVEGIEQWKETGDSSLNVAYWYRKGDDVVVIKPNCGAENSWRFGGRNRKLFAYNVKTKVRFYGELNNNSEWSFPIPSLSYVTNAMWLGRFREYDYTSRTYYYYDTSTEILGGITVKELFVGTNVEWVIDNIPEDCKVLPFDFNTNTHYWDSNDTVEPVRVKDLLKQDKIGTIALKIIVTTGIPMMEQLLKSNLFNLYFCAIDDMDFNGDGRSIRLFYDLDKKRTEYSWRSQDKLDSYFLYKGKEKNLKKMFGMPLSQLKEIDSLMKLDASKERMSRAGWRNSAALGRDVPQISGASNCLGVELSCLDPETFKRLLKISLKDFYRSSYYRPSSPWKLFGEDLKNAFPGKPPKLLLNLIEIYKGDLVSYRDYINMRTQLKKIQDVKPNIPGIYEEKHYPVAPGNAKRFLPFLAGMEDRQRYYYAGPQELTPENFIQNLQYDYPKAVERGEFFVSKEGERILGAYIHMTPEENLKFLHDEASYWISFYQDEAKEELFKKAVERVSPLEWKDEEMGLCIVAPKSIRDIKEEGSVLSHCVASYVDPIISGKENIVFLRRIGMENQPYYTIEVVNGGEIRQIHCYRNGNLTSEGQIKAYADSKYEVYNKTFDIVKFLLKWAKAMKGKVSSSSIRTTYGALCALR